MRVAGPSATARAARLVRPSTRSATAASHAAGPSATAHAACLVRSSARPAIGRLRARQGPTRPSRCPDQCHRSRCRPGATDTLPAQCDRVRMVWPCATVHATPTSATARAVGSVRPSVRHAKGPPRTRLDPARPCVLPGQLRRSRYPPSVSPTMHLATTRTTRAVGHSVTTRAAPLLAALPLLAMRPRARESGARSR